MPDKILSALRRDALTRAWRISASMASCGLQTRLVVNAMREAGGATELTSTAYLVANSQAAAALATSLADKLGCPAAAIQWGPPSLGGETAPAALAA